MRQEKEEESYESYPTQLLMSTMIEDLKARKGVDATEEGIREQYSHAFNPMINEGFFADKVVIVEGPSEQYVLPIYVDAFGYDLDRNNISVVHSDGKGQMDRLLRVFDGFKIIKIVEKIKEVSYTEGILQKVRKELYEGKATEDGNSMPKFGFGTALTQITFNDISN